MDANEAEGATPVLYAKRCVAKQLKTALEASGRIDVDHRMGAADPAAFASSFQSSTRSEMEGATCSSDECICIPVTDTCLKEYKEWQKNGPNEIENDACDWKHLVIASGRQHCMASASASARAKQGGRRRRRQDEAANTDGQDQQQYEPTLTQQAIIEMVQQLNPSGFERKEVVRGIMALSAKVCPTKLERFGDDRCLVIPRTALRLDEMSNTDEFRQFLERLVPHTSPEECLSTLWPILARLFGCPRVARRGDIDPESKIRQSGHRLLYPNMFDAIEPGIPSETGPGAPGWITVTEHGIRQSLDLTRVMFSRGNVTEKVRFSKLVQEGDVVLDMYAGIGYYTLPALIHGKAAHVYCCEWNPDAFAALKYNLRDNGVDDRATVLEGDSRVTTKQANIIDCVDRISLGLLPSCEGGWKTAVQALKYGGGWMHIHGNVPSAEKKDWSLWISHRLAEIARDDVGYNGWVAICCNVEKVKSFAPKVDHYVADVWVGPREEYVGQGKDEVVLAGILTKGDGETTKFEPCSDVVEEPSCALKKDGVLHQDWMM